MIEDKKTFKLTFKDQRRIINKEITLLDLVVEKQEEIERLNIGINKAIKFLKDNASFDEDVKCFCDDLRYDDCEILLKILYKAKESNK